ncbi:unnamed protein product [Rotaria socialis]|uniref:RING-type domain-containing protein n=1 Tax=Rotaria socialis TaxID=392032 RepID=A0A820HW20_9BILA|nr:unnamed protein product [Rotaria socialis]CAF4299791.1 unnamed protein product [Rotaria socialis]CAF4329173.1 unnamed protein product [Rotaria socialis]CAF4471223.1 unnamed protein product [Rotaria socialis]CAF4572766.1 unnamed protein product [Rotaria socialis]
MHCDSSSKVLSSMSVTLSRQGHDNNNRISSSQTKSLKSPINQFYCNICFCPLMIHQNMNRASFVTSCGHFYCEQCGQTTFQGLMPTCKICQCSSTNLTCMDLRKKQNDDVDVMISSNSRARRWFEEQTRHRTSEQMISTLDQRNAFLNKQNDFCAKTILRQADSVQYQVPFDKISVFGNKMIQETKQASEFLYKLLNGISQANIRLTAQQQLFCQQVVERVSYGFVLNEY